MGIESFIGRCEERRGWGKRALLEVSDGGYRFLMAHFFDWCFLLLRMASHVYSHFLLERRFGVCDGFTAVGYSQSPFLSILRGARSLTSLPGWHVYFWGVRIYAWRLWGGMVERSLWC